MMIMSSNENNNIIIITQTPSSSSSPSWILEGQEQPETMDGQSGKRIENHRVD